MVARNKLKDNLLVKVSNPSGAFLVPLFELSLASIYSAWSHLVLLKNREEVWFPNFRNVYSERLPSSLQTPSEGMPRY